MPEPPAFPPVKNRRPMWALYVARLVSVTGDAMAAIAIPWFVLLTTGSAVQTGITAFFSISPIVIGMFFGGALVDRVGYKRVSIAADLASGLTILLIPILHYSVGLSFPVLLALVFLGNLLDAPGRSARSAMLPELAKAAGYSLEQATAYSESVSRATGMIGAPIAGLLITLVGAPVVLLIDAMTFLVSAAAVLLFIPNKLIEVVKSESEGKTTYWQDLRHGFSFVRYDRLILMIILIVMVTNMVDTAAFSVGMPVLFRDRFGEETGATNLGILIGVWGAATVFGAILSPRLLKRFARRTLLTLGFGFAGVIYMLYGVMPPFWVYLASAAVIGIFIGPLNPVFSAFLYERVPRELRARVLGVLSAGVMVAMPLGGLVSGFLLEGVGVAPTLIVCGLVYFAAALIFRFNPAMRQIERQPSQDEETVLSELQEATPA